MMKCQLAAWFGVTLSLAYALGAWHERDACPAAIVHSPSWWPTVVSDPEDPAGANDASIAGLQLKWTAGDQRFTEFRP